MTIAISVAMSKDQGERRDEQLSFYLETVDQLVKEFQERRMWPPNGSRPTADGKESFVNGNTIAEISKSLWWATRYGPKKPTRGP